MMVKVVKKMRMRMTLQCIGAEKRSHSVSWKKSESGIGLFPGEKNHFFMFVSNLGVRKTMTDKNIEYIMS